MEKMICIPLGSEFDIKCPTGQPRSLISSHYDCPTFIILSVVPPILPSCLGFAWDGIRYLLFFVLHSQTFI